MEDFLPSGLMKDIVSKNESISNGKLRLHTIPPPDVEPLKKALSDQQLNFAQKERLSAAILHGDYHLSTARSFGSIESEELAAKLRARDAANMARHTFNEGGLGVISQPAKLLPPETTRQKMNQIKRCQNLGFGDREYSWNRTKVPTVPVYIPPTTLPATNQTGMVAPEDYVNRREAQIQYKLKGAQQVKALRHVANNWGVQYSEARRKQIMYRRKVVAFRQKLFERLRERNDPQTSDIMRTIDDHTIEVFIHKFKGCAMSLDAIIHNMGSTLQPSASNLSVGNLISVPSEETVTAENYAKTGESDVFQFTASGFEDDGNVGNVEYLREEMSLSSGESSPSRYKKVSRGLKTSPKKQLGMGSIGVGKRDSLEILVNPRPIISMGAGFRSANPKAFNPGNGSGRRSRGGNSAGLGVGLSEELDGSTVRPASADSQKLVHHVKLQLQAEGKLQSSQPDKILTEEELQNLASNKISFESIADSLSSASKSSFRVARAPRNLGKVVISNRKPPIALKTTHADMTNGPYDAPVPYKKPPKYGPGSSAVKRTGAKKTYRDATPPLSTSEKIRPLSTTNYGGLYVISSYKEEHPSHQAFTPPPAKTPPPE